MIAIKSPQLHDMIANSPVMSPILHTLTDEQANMEADDLIFDLAKYGEFELIAEVFKVSNNFYDVLTDLTL